METWPGMVTEKAKHFVFVFTPQTNSGLYNEQKCVWLTALESGKSKMEVPRVVEPLLCHSLVGGNTGRQRKETPNFLFSQTNSENKLLTSEPPGLYLSTL